MTLCSSSSSYVRLLLLIQTDAGIMMVSFIKENRIIMLVSNMLYVTNVLYFNIVLFCLEQMQFRVVFIFIVPYFLPILLQPVPSVVGLDLQYVRVA